MRSAIFRQYDSRWGSLKYPSGVYTLSRSGCGCCACTHLIIEKDEYKNYTPKNVRPYMIKQGFATLGNGTTWNGITKTLEHYGFKVVKPNIATSMTSAWKELNKGNRAGVLLFRGGSRGGVTWTSGGHYVAFLDYKVKNGKHYFYTKDSGSRKHDGWYCYETTMMGLLPQMWIVELPKKASTTVTTTTTKKPAASAPAAPKKKTASEKAQSYGESNAGTYKVVSDDGLMNVRNGAGTSKKVLVTIPNGTKVKNYGYYTKTSGIKWLLVQFDYKGTTYTGFCSSGLLKRI